MPTRHTDEGPVWRRRSQKEALLHWAGLLVMAAVVAYCVKLVDAGTNWTFVVSAGDVARDLGGRMWPPDWTYAANLLEPIVDTIHIATLGTVAALAIAFPLAFLAARNTTPSTRFVRPVALLAIVVSRSVNSVIWALILVYLVGPGMLAGIVAIALRSVGFCTKLLYEEIEEIDPDTVEAMEATGASTPQVLNYGIVPQITPAFAGLSIYRWDINIRESTVVGLVGAGGIGMQLQAALESIAWSQVFVIFLFILATVVVSEWVSARVRAAVT
jgi:phosphonate transport system permease protein